jgi:glycosyltransferase involved in cell wall biosynthesis
MRVIHVAPTTFGPSGLFGGGERYPLELARALAPHVECELITFGSRPTRMRDSAGLLHRVIRPAGLLGGHRGHPVSPALIAPLLSAGIVHIHHLLATPSRTAAFTARALGRSLVATDHGLHGTDWAGLTRRLVERFLLVSVYSARLLRAPRSRTRLIYGGADPVRFRPDPSASRDGVLFVGRITPHKGIDRLIDALPPGARLTVAGSTGHDRALPERDYPSLLRDLARDKDVCFLTPLPEGRLPALYRRARVFVLPSVHHTCYGGYEPTPELLGLTVLEAMASGTPVVASRVGGVPEIVQHGVTGFLIEPGNVEELRDRIAELLRDPALAGRMGRNARDLVLDRFTWDVVADRCLEEYASLARLGRSTPLPRPRTAATRETR